MAEEGQVVPHGTGQELGMDQADLAEVLQAMELMVLIIAARRMSGRTIPAEAAEAAAAAA